MRKVINAIGNAIDKTGEAFDKNFTSKEEILTKVNEAQKSLQDARQAMLLAEASGSKLQRNWRPILMLAFGFIIIYSVVVAPLLFHYLQVPQPELTPDFWDVLKLSIGGYVIGRSGEKVVPGVTDAVKKYRRRRHERKAEREN
ncbi:MAG: holin family protein [Carboxylicivirga sp.]|jgi:hypothetical protein|nr:holin family protein [Carboxylicivirga sp.]